MRYDRMVIAYHGCELEVAERVLAGESLVPSDNDYDWLGRGVYFWEYGAERALQFAQEQASRGRIRVPAYLGALVQLGNCFDLLDTRFTQDLAAAHAAWLAVFGANAQVALPVNAGPAPDHKLRRLDCSVINWYLNWVEQQRGQRFDAVRCGFVEGAAVYPGSGIFTHSHIQVAVRNPACIVGVFRPRIAKS